MSIKFILDSGSARSIVMLQLINQLGFKVDCTMTSQIITADESTKLHHGKINSFPFGINELFISYNGHHARIPATCGHFQKASTNQRPTFKFKKNPALPAIKTYQLLWADNQKTELLAIPTWRKCLVCNKKLLFITACSILNKNPRNFIYYYCNHCNKEKYGYPENMENGMENHVLLVENCYQKDATELTCQTEEKCVTQLANTRFSS
ncbi:hypothetical protein G9A89_015754, partial [Geosiphon pyriformis]